MRCLHSGATTEGAAASPGGLQSHRKLSHAATAVFHVKRFCTKVGSRRALPRAETGGVVPPNSTGAPANCRGVLSAFMPPESSSLQNLEPSGSPGGADPPAIADGLIKRAVS